MTNKQTGCLHPSTTLFVKREDNKITINITELKDDDQLLGVDGEYHEHGGLRKRMFSGDMLKITMPDFTNVIVTPDHLMPTSPVGLTRGFELSINDKLPYRATKDTNKIYYRKIYDITKVGYIGEVYDITDVYKSFYVLGNNLIACMSDHVPKSYTVTINVTGEDESIDTTAAKLYYAISPFASIRDEDEWLEYTEPITAQEGYNLHVDARVNTETGYKFTGWSDGSQDTPRVFNNINADISIGVNLGYVEYTLEFTPDVAETGSFAYKLNAEEEDDWTPYENALGVNVNDVLIVKAVPTTGYTFDGWVDDEDGTMTDTRTFTNTLESGIYKAAFTLIE